MSQQFLRTTKGNNSKGTKTVLTPSPSRVGLSKSKQVSYEESRILEDVQSNIDNVNANFVHEQFKNLNEVYQDPTSPLFNTSDILAEQITGVVADPVPQPQTIGSDIDMEAIRDTIIQTAAQVGVVMEPSYMEDLMVIAGMKKSLSELDAWMYFRGVSRANQISQTTVLSKLVAQMDTSLSKCSAALTVNAENSRLIFDKQASLGVKIDGILPSVGNKIDGILTSVNSSVLSVSSSVVSALNSLRSPAQAPPIMIPPQVTARVPRPNLIPHSPIQPTLLTPVKHQASSSSSVPQLPKPSAPGYPEILMMCQAVSCPENKALEIHNKYPHKLTWSEYGDVVSGKTGAQGFARLIASLKDR